MFPLGRQKVARRIKSCNDIDGTTEFHSPAGNRRAAHGQMLPDGSLPRPKGGGLQLDL